MNRKMKIGLIWFLLLAVAGSTGCVARQSIREVFVESSTGLTAPERQALLEAVQILSLLEHYRLSVEMKETEAISRCFSSRFSYYEKGLSWLREKMGKELFAPFDSLRVTFSGIEISLIEKYGGHWMRQEDFDWLEGPQAQTFFTRPYRIEIYSGSAPVEVLFEADSGVDSPLNRRRPGRERVRGGGDAEKVSRSSAPGERYEERVDVSFATDSEVMRPLGEVSFSQVLQAQTPNADGTGSCTYTLREKVIFLLEKEEGGWRIVSVR